MKQEIVDHFKAHDPILYSYIKKMNFIEPELPSDLFVELCDSIISQQLSGKAAATIFARFSSLFSSKKITARALLQRSDDELRACGTSWAKVRSLKDLAQKVIDKQIHLDKLQDMTDDDVIIELTRVKGIGPWTAEMFLMFALGRPDVFSYGDLGLKNGIKKIYGLKSDPTRKQIEKIVEKWKPYRTFACRVLWKSLEM